MTASTEGTMTDTQQQPSSSQQNRAAMAAWAAKISGAVKGAKLSPSEQMRVAENTWLILVEAERKGVAKSAVLHEGGAGNEGDSTKRLERFALNPDLDAASKQTKAGKLTKGAGGYLRIAEAAGRLAEGDATAYVATLFNGTRFAAAGDAALTEDVYVELADLLRTVCTGIARKHGLQQVFRICDERYLCYYGSLRQNRDDRWSEVWRGFADGARVVGLLTDEDAPHGQSWAMPYPSVLVGWADLVRDLPFLVTKAPPRATSAEPAASGNSPDDVVVNGALKLEIRLALLPLGPGGTPEPAFIACPWVFIPFGHMREQYETGPNGRITAPTGVWAFEAQLPGVGTNGAMRGTPRTLEHYGYLCEPQFGEEAWAETFEGFKGVEPGCFYYDVYGSRLAVRVDLVSPSSCRRYLSLRRATSAMTDHGCPTVLDDLEPALAEMTESERYKHWRDIDEGTLEDPESPRWRTEPGTLAESVEYCLLYMDRSERRFDAVLDRACARYVADVSEILSSVDGWRETVKAELRAKWGKNSPTGGAVEE